MSYSLQLLGLNSPWNSPGQNTGVGSLSLLQGIFSTQGSHPDLPHCRLILYQLKGSLRTRGNNALNPSLEGQINAPASRETRKVNSNFLYLLVYSALNRLDDTHLLWEANLLS